MEHSIPTDVLKLLLEADRSGSVVNRENYEDACAEVRKIAKSAESILSQPVVVDLCAEDASFYAELTLRTPIEPDAPSQHLQSGGKAIRFSLIFSESGRLVRVSNYPEWSDPPSDTQVANIDELLRANGFFPISDDHVQVGYSGEKTTHDGTPMSDIDGYTWADHFFSWE